MAFSLWKGRDLGVTVGSEGSRGSSGRGSLAGQKTPEFGGRPGEKSGLNEKVSAGSRDPG